MSDEAIKAEVTALLTAQRMYVLSEQHVNDIVERLAELAAPASSSLPRALVWIGDTGWSARQMMAEHCGREGLQVVIMGRPSISKWSARDDGDAHLLGALGQWQADTDGIWWPHCTAGPSRTGDSLFRLVQDPPWSTALDGAADGLARVYDPGYVRYTLGDEGLHLLGTRKPWVVDVEDYLPEDWPRDVLGKQRQSWLPGVWATDDFGQVVRDAIASRPSGTGIVLYQGRLWLPGEPGTDEWHEVNVSRTLLREHAEHATRPKEPWNSGAVLVDTFERYWAHLAARELADHGVPPGEVVNYGIHRWGYGLALQAGSLKRDVHPDCRHVLAFNWNPPDWATYGLAESDVFRMFRRFVLVARSCCDGLAIYHRGGVDQMSPEHRALLDKCLAEAAA